MYFHARNISKTFPTWFFAYSLTFPNTPIFRWHLIKERNKKKAPERVPWYSILESIRYLIKYSRNIKKYDDND